MAGIVGLPSGRTEPAMAHSARAGACGPMAAASHVALAIAAERAGRRDDAVREWEAARRIAPDDALILDKLAAAWAADPARAADVERARRHFLAAGRRPTAATA